MKKIDEVQLTALALGELPEDEKAEVLRMLQDDPESQQAYQEIQQSSDAFRQFFAEEASPALGHQRIDSIIESNNNVFVIPAFFKVAIPIAAAVLLYVFLPTQKVTQPSPSVAQSEPPRLETPFAGTVTGQPVGDEVATFSNQRGNSRSRGRIEDTFAASTSSSRKVIQRDPVNASIGWSDVEVSVPGLRADVVRELKKYESTIMNCYQAFSSASHFELQLHPSGQVMQTESANRGFNRCLKAALPGVSFPQHSLKYEVNVPFQFNSL